MVNIKNLKDLTGPELDNLFNRFGEDFSSIMINTVAPIVNEVKAGGDMAVKKYTEKFDGVKLNEIMASKEETERGFNSVSQNL
ncbi:MAG: histidinol dehydrogenase, partial [Leptospirales bacterium]|nr:histidinol dehydrogenase [Leptospirales bacterium]